MDTIEKNLAQSAISATTTLTSEMNPDTSCECSWRRVSNAMGPAAVPLSATLINDGDIDIVVSNAGQKAYVLRNDGGNRGNWIRIENPRQEIKS